MLFRRRVILTLINNLRLSKKAINFRSSIRYFPVPSIKVILTMAAGTMPIAVEAINTLTEDTSEISNSAESVQEIIKQADDLYLKNEVELLYEFLSKYKDLENADVLWRLARATCDKAKMMPNKETKKKLMHDAFDHAESALKIGENNFACHKWYAIMLDYVGEYQGTKERLLKAFEIKDHFLKAIELNNKDATSVHLLGYWCFVFADLPWYQQKLASIVFATPPTSSYKEALEYFLKAEEIEENFYSMNLLMIGKTYLRMKEKDLAKKFLQKTLDYVAKTEDDKKAILEAKELMKSV